MSEITQCDLVRTDKGSHKEAAPQGNAQRCMPHFFASLSCVCLCVCVCVCVCVCHTSCRVLTDDEVDDSVAVSTWRNNIIAGKASRCSSTAYMNRPHPSLVHAPSPLAPTMLTRTPLAHALLCYLP